MTESRITPTWVNRPRRWWGSLTEAYSAISRLRRNKAISDPDEQGALVRLRMLSRGWKEVLPDDQLRDWRKRPTRQDFQFWSFQRLYRERSGGFQSGVEDAAVQAELAFGQRESRVANLPSADAVLRFRERAGNSNLRVRKS